VEAVPWQQLFDTHLRHERGTIMLSEIGQSEAREVAVEPVWWLWNELQTARESPDFAGRAP
jgi:hypothetical protein